MKISTQQEQTGRPAWHRRTSSLLALACLALLVACGGGGTGGVGSGGTGITAFSGSAQGTVSGFGSVIVDGVEYDDSKASVRSEDATGTQQLSTVKLGQRVQLSYDASRAAQSIQVIPQLIGPVDAVNAAANTVSVMGQSVRLVTSATDSTQSSLTVLAGYASVTSLQVGDEVEVHGAWADLGGSAGFVLFASRLEKRSSSTDPLLLSGLLQSINGSTLRLNRSSGPQFTATGLPALEVGQLTRVWFARSALGNLLAGRVVAASRVVNLSASTPVAATQVTVSGLASNYDSQAGTLTVQGQKFSIPADLARDGNALSGGQFVTIQANSSSSGTGAGASTGKLVVSSVQGRSNADLGRQTLVKGNVQGVDWKAAQVGFWLRNTWISASAAAISASCRGFAITANVAVELQGYPDQRLDSPPDNSKDQNKDNAAVSATQVLCKAAT